MQCHREMHVIIYAGADVLINERLLRAVSLHVSKGRIDTCSTLKELVQRLHLPLPVNPMLVLLADRPEALPEIMEIKELLLNHRIILILPDDVQETTALAHALRPRFTTYIDSDFTDVSAVLGKIIDLERRKESILSALQSGNGKGKTQGDHSEAPAREVAAAKITVK